MKFYVYHFNHHGLKIAADAHATLEEARQQVRDWSHLMEADESVKIVEREEA